MHRLSESQFLGVHAPPPPPPPPSTSLSFQYVFFAVHYKFFTKDLLHNDDQFKYYFMCISISLNFSPGSCVCNSKQSSFPNEATKVNLDARKLIFKMLAIMKVTSFSSLLSLTPPNHLHTHPYPPPHLPTLLKLYTHLYRCPS